jgi:hypothetical protein
VVLAQDKYPISNNAISTLDNLNTTFYAVFLFEMILKLIGLGIKNYMKDFYNKFDFMIVLISTIDVVMSELTIFKI